MKSEWICTCEAGYRGEVYHCPMHAAAPEMAELLKVIADEAPWKIDPKWQRMARAILETITEGGK